MESHDLRKLVLDRRPKHSCRGGKAEMTGKWRFGKNAKIAKKINANASAESSASENTCKNFLCYAIDWYAFENFDHFHTTLVPSSSSSHSGELSHALFGH